VVQTLVGVEDMPAAVERAPAGARDLYLRLVEQRLRRIIQSARGHPALVAWRLPLPAGAAFAHYARLAREEDPSRPIIPTGA